MDEKRSMCCVLKQPKRGYILYRPFRRHHRYLWSPMRSCGSLIGLPPMYTEDVICMLFEVYGGVHASRAMSLSVLGC